MSTRQVKNREDEEIRSKSSKEKEKTAQCASCGRKIKKKALWGKGKPYCSLECLEG
ncbi:MAG: hypothetical protein QME81_10010 [bacterium]|nr:hypothetical protein [bacterium]